MQAPYFDVLGLHESDFATITKEDVWKAFFARRVAYKQADPEGSLMESLKDAADRVDWDLIMEAYMVVDDQVARAEYESRNLLPHARSQLVCLRVMHEARMREELPARREAPEAAEAGAG